MHFLYFKIKWSCTFSIAAELLKLVERAVLAPKKEGKLREGNFDWYIFKKSIHILLDTRRPKKRKKKEKRVSCFGQSKVHLSRYNLRKCTIKDSAQYVYF